MNILLFLTLLLVCCGYSACFGGTAERLGAAILMVAVLATMLIGRIWFRHFSGPELGLLLTDLATFLAFTALALRADRYWPMAVAACLGVGILMHASIWIAPHVVPRVYATLHAFSGYPALLILAAGTYRHRRRRVTHKTLRC